jgi:hypothetical protein
MKRGANTKLESFTAQRRALEALRKSGRIDMACVAAGVSLATFIRFRNNNPIFDNAVFEAIAYYNFVQELEYSTKVRNKALKLFEELIDSGQINHNVLIKFLFERDGRIGN